MALLTSPPFGQLVHLIHPLWDAMHETGDYWGGGGWFKNSTVTENI